MVKVMVVLCGLAVTALADGFGPGTYGQRASGAQAMFDAKPEWSCNRTVARSIRIEDDPKSKAVPKRLRAVDAVTGAEWQIMRNGAERLEGPAQPATDVLRVAREEVSGRRHYWYTIQIWRRAARSWPPPMQVLVEVHGAELAPGPSWAWVCQDRWLGPGQ